MDRMLQELLELMAISSPSFGERQMADTVKQKLVELGCEVEEDDVAARIGGTAGNLIARLPGDGRGEPLLLSAHLDRVPNGDNIKPVIRDGILTSDGTTILAADDLAGVVAILEGVRRIRESGLPHGDVEIVFTVCEEMKTQGSRNLDCSRLRSKAGYCLDSSGRIGRIIRAAPTIVRLYIDVYGKAAHAGAEPEKGVNALKGAAKILAELEEGRLDFETTSNWAIMKTGPAKNTNVVCPHCQLIGEVRSHDPQKVEDYIAYVQRHGEEALAEFPATFTLTRSNDLSCFCIPEDAPVITKLTEVLRGMGREPWAEKGGGGMDANWFNAGGIATVGVATGYLKNHTPDELLHLQDFADSAGMVYRLILAFAEQ